jgi:hypothetical protein
MTGGGRIHIGNAVHLRRWSLTGSDGACPGAAKMLRSEPLSPDLCRCRCSWADMMTPISWRTSSRWGVVATCP